MNGAYTRYDYVWNDVQTRIFSTIVDMNNNNIGDTADEVMSESWSDGAGRLRKSRTEHPGSFSNWAGSLVEYDSLGRVKRTSVPTEVSVDSSGNFTPAGDDATRGWLWTSQEYDWKDRVVREVNTDGTDRLMSYQGCGCAGGEMVTMQSELVPRDDQPLVNARRTQKVYADVLGRNYKTEVLNWDGAVYTSTLQTFNGRDQVVKTTQYPGAIGTAGYQDVLMTYDGHGRTKTRHYPIEDALANTIWIYNADDAIQQVIDPRGAITNYTYADARGLLTNISYTQPANNPASTDPRYVAATPSVTFQYDNVGNRTQMTDGTGTQTYAYDQLSRITSETKTFSVLAGNAYTISYTYNLGGGLKSYTDPFGASVSYTNDKAGRILTVAGTPWAQNTSGNYANNFRYRAFGQIKELNYTMPAETSEIKLEYDNRLRVNHFEAALPSATNGFLMKANHAYFSDGRTQAKDDLLNDAWDRTLKFDFAARLKFNEFGMGPANDPTQGTKEVYRQTIAYDAFSQMTLRATVHWDTDGGFIASYTNGRKDSLPGEIITFDASGNIVYSQPSAANPHDLQNMKFDAAGRRTKFNGKMKGRQGGWLNYISEDQVEQVFDGEGRPVIEKSGHRSYHINNIPTTTLTTNVTGYQIWSSVLGVSLTELAPVGTKLLTNVYVGAALIAKQNRYTENGINYDATEWSTADPVTGTVGKFGYSSEGTSAYKEEIEPLGQKIHPNDPADYEPTGTLALIGSATEPEWQCIVYKELYGSFQELPSHCQIKALDAAGSTLPWEFETRENPLRTTSLNDSPIPRGGEGNSPSDNALAFALKSTSKKGPHSGGDGDDDDDGVENPRRRKRHSIGTFTVDVKASLIDMSDTGMPDASESGEGLNQCGKGKPCPPIKPPPPPKLPPCPPVPEHPQGANVDLNIIEARRLRPQGPVTAVDSALWFKNKVKPRGDWDYKVKGKPATDTAPAQYENFGNFNYGATGTAIGFKMPTLLSEAGKIQAVPPGGKPESWGYPEGRFFGKGKYPYGDQPEDAAQVEAGANYYQRKFVLKDCE